MKWWAKLSLILFILGLILTVIGFSLGGSMIEMFRLNGEESTLEEEYKIDEIKSLDLEIGAAKVEIREGTGFRIKAQGTFENRFSSKVENGTWKIKNKGITSNFFAFGNQGVTILIEVPKDMKFENLKLDIGAGQLQADKLMAQNSKIEVGAGNLKMKEFVTDRIDLNCGVGNVEIAGDIKQGGKVECGIGNVMIQLVKPQENYNYKVEVGIGEVRLGNDSYSGLGNERRINSNPTQNYFDLSCGVGKVEIKFDK